MPASYKWWLLNYGGGQIGGDLVYGLDEQEIGMPDIISLAQLNARNGFHGIERLEFYVGNEESFYFDTTKMADSGEYDVYWYDADANDSYFYASSFAEFLKKRVNEIYRL